MSWYTPPYQLTDAILALSTEIAAKVKKISIRSSLSTYIFIVPTASALCIPLRRSNITASTLTK